MREVSNARAIDPAIIRGVSIPVLEMSNSWSRNSGRVTFESAIMERYKRREISVEEAMAIHAKGKPGRGGKESKERIAGKLSNMKFGKAAELVRSGSEETFSHHGFPALSIGNESGPITAWSKP